MGFIGRISRGTHVPRTFGIICVTLGLLGVACDGSYGQGAAQSPNRAPVPASAEIARVKVGQGGTIYLNGRPVSLEELKREFDRLKQASGTVWYYRENPQGKPPPQALAVIQAIVEAKLPVKLFEKDFE